MKRRILTGVLAISLSVMMLAGCTKKESSVNENKTTETETTTVGNVATTPNEDTTSDATTDATDVTDATEDDSFMGHISSIGELPYVIPNIIDEETGEEGVPGVVYTDVKLDDVLAAKPSALTFTYVDEDGQNVEWSVLEALNENSRPEYDDMGEEEIGRYVKLYKDEVYYAGMHLDLDNIVNLYNELYDNFGVPIRSRAVGDGDDYYIELHYIFADSSSLSIIGDSEEISVTYTTAPWFEG